MKFLLERARPSTYQVVSRAFCAHRERLPSSRLSVSQDCGTGPVDEALQSGLGCGVIDGGLSGVLVEHRVKAVGLAVIWQVQLKREVEQSGQMGQVTQLN